MPPARGSRAEQHTFGQQLLHDAPAAGAERSTQRDLLGPAVGAHQQQVGQVGAGDEQHQRDGAEQHQQRQPRVADQILLQRHDQRTPVLVLSGILLRQACGQRIQVGLGLRHRNTGLQLGHGALGDVGGAPAQRRPDLNLLEERRRRHDADHRVRGEVEQNRPAEDRRVAAEAGAPEGVAQQHGRRAAVAVVLGGEAAPITGCRPKIGRKLAEARRLSTAVGSPCPVRVGWPPR
jgi:hypothetical protein